MQNGYGGRITGTDRVRRSGVGAAADRSILIHDGYKPVNMAAPNEITQLLVEWSNGRQDALDELRFFGGLSTEETAEVLGISPRTVKREWRLAKAWLYHELTQRRP